MKTDRLWLVVGMVSLVVGCGAPPPPDARGGARGSLAAKLKMEVTYTATATETATVTNTATATQTETQTQTATVTETTTDTYTATATQTETYTDTSTSTETQTATESSTHTATGTTTQSETYTQTSTYAQSSTYTQTGTATQTVLVTSTYTQTATATGVTGTATATATGNVTGTASGTLTATIYYISPVTYSRTVTSTVYANDGGNVSGTACSTTTATYTSGTLTVTGTTTATGTVGAWVSGTGTNTLTVLANQTTASRTVLRTNTATGTGTGTITYAQTGTATTTGTLTGSSTDTTTITQTQTLTETNSATQTETLTQTSTVPTTNTLTETSTVTQTLTPTATSTLTRTDTITQTLGGTSTQVITETGTQTTTVTSTVTQTQTPTETATATGNVTGTASGTFTATIYYISPVTYSRTVTSTVYKNDGGNISGTACSTTTATYTSGTFTVTGTTTATGTVGAWVSGTGTNTLTVGANQTTASLSVLRTSTATGTGTGTITYTRTQTATASTTSTATDTATSTAIGTVTIASTVTNIGTVTATLTSTVTNTTTDTLTNTITVTSTSTETSVACTQQNWPNTDCGQFCTNQTQEDRKHCDLFLDCYFANNCSPETCGGQDDVCGVNHPGLNQWGVAPKIVADQVFKCMGCPGSVDCASPLKLDGTLCADGDACTQYDTCQGGVCVGAYPVTCTASDQCHIAGECDPDTGVCSNATKPDGTGCDDGQACTENDACTAGTCGGTSYSCDDGIGCTTDVCNGDGTCTFVREAGSCMIGGACYLQGAPNPQNPCQACDSADPETWTSVPNDTQCDDGNGCTTGDVCQGGFCTGSGSGYVGPGEQCAPPTPASPGPFGDFRCLLEEIPGSVKNVLTIGTGDLAMSWMLRGSMDFSFTASGAKMTKLSATGQKSRLSVQNGIVLTQNANVPSAGSVDTTNGNVQMTMPIHVRYANGTGISLPLTFTGQVADRVLQGEATAPGGAGGHVKLFCREQFRNVVASATFQLDGTGNFVASGPIAVFEGTPTMPSSRSLPGPGDLVAELVSVTGEILDQYGIGQPWTATFPNLPLPAPPPDPSQTVDVTIRAPLSNRLGSIMLRTSTGVTVATSDLTQAIDSFCAGAGSQYCDYRAGVPVRTVFYAPGTPAPGVNPSFAEVALPSSPRLDGDEFVLTTNWEARQPDVALDADGNAIVVWREDYEKIMAQGISKTGQTLFGPTRINDVPCVTGWVPGEPPPDEIIEWGDQFTARAVVATSNTARKPDGSADSTFAVAWGGLVDFVWHGSPDAVVTVTFQCSRLMNGDGTALQDPVMVVPAPSWDGSEVSLSDDTHVSLAMTESHKYVIAWSEYVEGAGRYCVAARSFGADGLPATANAVFVSHDEPHHAMYPTVAMDKNGQAAIVWIRTDDPDTSSPSTGHVRMQRFNTDFTKRGDIVTIGASTLIGGLPSVAMRPSTGDILITARSKDGDIYATRTRFSDGAVLDSWSRANSRAVGTQARPVAVMNGEGGYLLAWMDEVGPESSRKNPITAQVYSGDGRPLDIDFTASPQTPIYTDANGNPDFYWSSAFAFRAGAAQNDYALVWQRPTVNHGTPEDPDYEGGIVLQRLGGGAPDCPAPTDCGTAVPIRVTGATEGKIDVILTPGEIVHYDTGAVLTSFTTPYTSEVEFGRKAVDLIVNGYLANNVFSKYVNEFNFYFDMTQGKRRMQYLGGECQYLWGGTAAGGTMGGTAMFKAIGYQGSTTFANVGAVIMRHYNPCGGIDQEERGLAVARYGASGDQDARTGGALPFWVKNADDYSSLVHESGHAVFGLREEYCVGGAKEDPLFHSNSFDNQQRCVDFSVNPDNACRAIPGRSANVCGGGFWKADPDDCAMSDGWGTQFGLDCQRRAQCVVEDIRNTNDCP